MKYILLFISLPFLVNAQFSFTNNGNPPDIKWKEISNESARIIFAEGLESRAYRVADVIDYLNKNNRASIGKRKGKINIILQNQLTDANGFVTAAPFRSEFFTTAPQRSFSGTGDWLDLLAIHEYRHVMQLQFAKQGATKIGSILLGDIGWLGMGFMAIPFWFTEGDAVMQETLLSEGGRGRSGGFLAEFRAMHEAGINFQYEKIKNRSYKSILPNRYPLGYLLSQFGRNKYGNSFWREVSRDAVRYKGVLWPFSQSLQKRTGKNVHNYYKEMMDSVYHKWDVDAKKDNWKQADEVLVNKPIPNDRISYYLNPKFKDDKILVLRSGRDRTPAFCSIDNKGNEKKLFDIGYQDSYFNYKNNKLVWTQVETDIRWSTKTFSNVYTYDFTTKMKTKISSKTKFFSPDINADGTRILVVNSDEMMKYNIKVLDGNSGEVLSTIPNPKNLFYSSPKWLDDNSIIAIVQHNQKNALVKVDIATGDIITLVNYTHNLILRPVVSKGFVYFSGDFTSIRNIYAVDLNTKELFQVTNSRVLASHPDVSDAGSYLLYSEQQINGFDIKKIKLDKKYWRNISITEPKNKYIELNKLVSDEKGSILNNIPSQNYKVKDYTYFKDLIHFHSWYPTLGAINNEWGFGASFISTNLLSTLGIAITPMINVDGEARLSTKLEYNKYYPKLSLNYDISKIYYVKENESASIVRNYYFLGVEFPFDFSRGAWNRGVSLGTNIGVLKYNWLKGDREITPDSRFVFSNKLRFYNKEVVAFQQLNPRFGQELDIDLRSFSKEIDFTNKMNISINAKLYFPGFKRTHSFTIGGHFHEYNKDLFLGSYKGIRGAKENVFSINHVLHFDYNLPLFYPDLAIGPIAFVKRIRANVFYDFGFSDVEAGNKWVGSLGLELKSDLGVLNFGSVFNLPVGVRFSYLTGEKYNWNIQFILN